MTTNATVNSTHDNPDQIRVAVIIPAHNAARTLSSTLESVFAQTIENFEAVVVDDGSTDTTFEIASAFARKDARFKVIRQRNGGIADARNTAILHTKAPLVAPLDADDIWHPSFLEKLCAALEQGGKDTVAAYANARIIDLEGQVLYDAPSYDASGWTFHRLLIRNFIGNGSGMIFRRDLAVRVGAYDRRLQYEFGAWGSEDRLLALRLAAHGKIVAVREYLVGYRLVPGSMSTNTLRMRRSRVAALEILYAEIECRGSQPAKWALGTAHAKCFLHEVRSLLFGKALRSLLAGLRSDPIGTLYLLFGRERFAWFRRKFFEQGIYPQRGAFYGFDPLEGQWDTTPGRIATAWRWDAMHDGPVADLAKTGTRQSLENEV